jgi:putative ABC transport system permease protein
MHAIQEANPAIAWSAIRRGDHAFIGAAEALSIVVFSVGLSGAIALLLSATGLYALLSYAVTLRRWEIGIRLAIGAAPTRIIALMLRQAARLVAIGIAIGVGLALPAGLAMRASFSTPVEPFDPWAFLPGLVTLTLAGTVAATIPATRAARVDPIRTLRED